MESCSSLPRGAYGATWVADLFRYRPAATMIRRRRRWNGPAEWQRGLGAGSPAGSGADGNSNGVVDAADLAIWKSNFGVGAAVSAAAAAALQRLRAAAPPAPPTRAAVDAVFAAGDFTQMFLDVRTAARTFRPRTRLRFAG